MPVHINNDTFRSGGRKPDSQLLRTEWETDVKETSSMASLAVREGRKGRKLREP